MTAAVMFGREQESAIDVRFRIYARAAEGGWISASLAQMRPDSTVAVLTETKVTTASAAQYVPLVSAWTRLVYTPRDDGAVLVLMLAAGWGEGDVMAATLEWKPVRP